MVYQAMTLREEIRRCIYTKGATHPENIRRWIIQDRLDRCLAGNMKPKKMQALKTIENNLRTMEDLEKVGDCWQFVDETKLTRAATWITTHNLMFFTTEKNYLIIIHDLLTRLKI
jgi:hypothetical protein